MSPMSDEQNLLRELFNLIDEDGSGSVDKAELRAFLNCLPNFKEDKFPRLFAKIDEDKSGEVDFEEFTSVLDEVCKELPTDVIIQTVTEERDRKAEQMRKKRAMFEQKNSNDSGVQARGRTKSVVIAEPAAPPAPAGPDNSKELEELRAKLRQMEEDNARLKREAEEAHAKAAAAAAAAASAASSASTSSAPAACPKCSDNEKEIDRLKQLTDKKQRELDDAQRAERAARESMQSASSKTSGVNIAAEEEIAKLKRELGQVRKQLEAEREQMHAMRGKNAIGPFGDPSSFAGNQMASDQRRTRAFYRWMQEETLKINQNAARQRSRSPPRTPRTGMYIAS